MAKDFRKIPIDRLHRYNGGDTSATLRLYRQQVERAADFEWTWRLVHGPAIHALRMMERWGAIASRDNIMAYDRELGEQLDRQRAELVTEGIAADFNPKSGKQLGALIKSLGLKSRHRTETGAESYGAEALRDMLTQRYHVAFDAEGKITTPTEKLAALRAEHQGLRIMLGVQKLLEFRSMRAMYGADYCKWIGYDGRVHTKYGLVRTGRLCLAAGTMVEIVRDVSKYPKGVPIEEVKAGDLAYSMDAKRKLCLRRVKWAGKTGEKKRLVRLHWRGSGHQSVGYVDLTSDHPVRLVDGTYREAAKLQPNDRVLALSRAVNGWGYARLYATGHEEIAREHRFIYQQLHGELPQHVHHANHNKLDNRPENLIGLSASNHTSLHGRACSPERRERHRQVARQRYFEGKSRLFPGSGPNNPNYLGLTKTQVIRALEENGWRMVKAAKTTGLDYGTLRKYAVLHGLPIELLRKLAKPQTWSSAKRANHPTSYNNHEVLRIEELPGGHDVYDLEVEETHCFFANEICVHNSSKEPNLQNLKSPDDGDEDDHGKRARGIYVPPEGHVIVSLDQSQIELRTMGILSGDEKMAQAFASGIDFHTATAALVFNKPAHLVSKLERRVAKVINFSIAFGKGAATLAVDLGVTPEKAQEYIDMWLVTYRQFAAWRLARMREAVDTGQVLARWGRWLHKRDLPDAADKQRTRTRLGPYGRPYETQDDTPACGHAKRVAVNTPVQNVANCFTLSSMASIVSWIQEKKVPAELNLNVHDALVLYVRRDVWREVAEHARKLMTSFDTGAIPLRVDMEVGEVDYGHMEAVAA